MIEPATLGHGEAGALVTALGRAVRARWLVGRSVTRRLHQERPVNPSQLLTRIAKLRLATEIVRMYVPTRARIVCNRSRLLEQVTGFSIAPALSRVGERSCEQKMAEAVRVGRTVARTLDLLPTDSSCLVRSTVLVRLLLRRGIESSLVIAVGGDGDSFIAHAWVEHHGVPLLNPGRDDLTRLVELDVLDDHKHDGKSD